MEEHRLEIAIGERQRATAVTVIPSGVGVMTVLGILYLVAPPIRPGLPFAISSFAAALIFLLLSRAVAVAPLRRVPALILVAALLAQAYALSFLYLTSDPAQSVVLMVTLIAASAGLQTTRTGIVTVIVGLLGWLLLAQSFPPAALRHWGINVVAASVLAITISRGRERSNRQEVQARMDLEDSRIAAEAAARAKAAFLANMSHEIRTPMNGVLGVLDLLAHDELHPDQQALVDTAQRSARSLLTVINDVLDFSKVEAGKLTLDALDFDPSAVLRDVCRLLEPTAAEKGISLTVAISSEVPRAVRGDPARLRQILVNLVGNAVKFTSRGGVSVEMGARPGPDQRITLDCGVIDTGDGIPADKIGLLFRSFSQGDVSTTRRFGGTGLGLAISKQLCELMGGTIEVDSTVNRGSTFRFTVCFDPAQEEAPAAKAYPTQAIETFPDDGRPIRVLLAEDNAVNQLVARRMLEGLGAAVDVVEDGRQAADAVARERYDLVFMDQHMPVMDGVEATAEIRRAEAGGRRTVIIALTASAFPEDRVRCLESGMDDFLAKPVARAALAELLQRWGKRSPAADQPIPGRSARSSAADPAGPSVDPPASTRGPAEQPRLDS